MHMTSLLAITALSLTLSVTAQTKTDKAHVNWGADMDKKEDGTFMDVIDDIDNSTFMVMGRHNKPFIQRMDGVKVAWQKPLELKMDKNDLELRRILLTENEILVFATHYSKKDNENSLYLSTYDQAGMKQQKRFVKLASIDAPKSSNPGAFNISSSPDHSKVLVHVMPPFEKNEAEKSRMDVYDAQMQMQWSQDFVLPYTDSEFRLESQRVDNDGSVLVVGVKYAEKQEKRALKRQNKATYEYHMLIYKGDSPVPEDRAITVPDRFLQDMTISLADEGISSVRASSATKTASMCAARFICGLTGPPSRSFIRVIRNSATIS